ncbi:hypothetical protein MKW98_022403 [Papaver atlanticum]|uniref:ELMO domain-containing protein n=1 Tax=Papaver atlanticum TaxID=357466 RepID=A0AAD4SGV3_9MAGN|nr:hypothetical protein MKW98_022403 [Papaver atlanticum]
MVVISLTYSITGEEELVSLTTIIPSPPPEFLNQVNTQKGQNHITISRLTRVEIVQQETLRALWDASYPGEELHGLASKQWKDMGWQGKDPSTDFRVVFQIIEEFIVLCKVVQEIFSGSSPKARSMVLLLQQTQALGIMKQEQHERYLRLEHLLIPGLEGFD